VVLDPFGGGGVTFLAARQMNRHFIGCELDGHWVEYSRKRLAEPYAVDMFAGAELAPVTADRAEQEQRADEAAAYQQLGLFEARDGAREVEA